MNDWVGIFIALTIYVGFFNNDEPTSRAEARLNRFMAANWLASFILAVVAAIHQ